MRFKVKEPYSILHSGEIGEMYARDSKRTYLRFKNGDTMGYLHEELESCDGGLTTEEQSVMDDLVSAWNKFIKLEKQHPCDINEFGDSIHKLQGILALRPLRRQYPDYWKSYKE